MGSGGVVEQNCTGITPAVDQSSVAVFAFHNDDPNGIRRGMTRGPAVYTDAIGMSHLSRQIYVYLFFFALSFFYLQLVRCLAVLLYRRFLQSA